MEKAKTEQGGDEIRSGPYEYGRGLAPTSVAVGTAATLISGPRSRLCMLIQNVGAADVYLGTTSGVTTANGIKLAPGAVWKDELTHTAWYGIVASGTVDVRVMETER